MLLHFWIILHGFLNHATSFLNHSTSISKSFCYFISESFCFSLRIILFDFWIILPELQTTYSSWIILLDFWIILCLAVWINYSGFIVICIHSVWFINYSTESPIILLYFCIISFNLLIILFYFGVILLELVDRSTWFLSNYDWILFFFFYAFLHSRVSVCDHF